VHLGSSEAFEWRWWVGLRARQTGGLRPIGFKMQVSGFD
jgi:hypothetical protein